MNTLLIYPNSPHNLGDRVDSSVRMTGKKAYLPPLGLITVAALLPQDWSMKLVDCSFQTVSQKDWNEAELVVISGTIVQIGSIIQVIREAKERGKIVAVGGPGVYHFQQAALDAGADFVVRGEGEVTVPSLLERLGKREFGVVIDNGTPADITLTPVPRYDLLDLNAYVDLSVQFSRGCPYRCEFCDVTLMFGRAIRTKTPQQMLAELQRIYDLGWRKQAHFVDDNFIGRPVRAKTFLKELISWNERRGMPLEFHTYASVNLAANPEIMELMVRAGFTMVALGIETTDREVLKNSRKFQNAVDLEEACSKINKAGLEVMALIILGFDGESPGRDARVIEFARKTRIPEVVVSLLHALNGTVLWERLKREGRLIETDQSNLGDWHNLQMNFVPTRPREEIFKEFVAIHQVLYEPDNYLERAFDHFDHMDPSPFAGRFKPPDPYELRILLATLWKQGVLYPTRKKFWKIFFTAAKRFSRDRFAHFIRAIVKMERYMDRRERLGIQLGTLTSEAPESLA
ncbi:MAG: radical SAM protein, partial [Desulfomonilaceae bacterium]|nr:radical SAM protein [Desulfomonilaceae bacterium]